MSKSAFANILNAMQKTNETGSFQQDDSNVWYPERDKAGNGFAIIRFLPGKTPDDIPFVKMYDHGFQGPSGKWYIENCPTTIGYECPCCQANGVLWATGTEANKDIVRSRKRRTTFFTNILVISDPKNSDNEGKVFLFKFGKKIWEKLKFATSPPPEFVDEKAINPFSPYAKEEGDSPPGANFKLKIRKVDGYANYDKSEFEDPSDVENIDELIGQLHDIQSFIDPKKYKSFEELETKLKTVLSSGDGSTRVAVKPPVVEDDFPEKVEEEPKKVSKQKKTTKAAPAPADDDEDSLEYFKKLAEED